MKHRRTPFLLVHWLLFSAAGREGAKGNPANVQTAQVPTIDLLGFIVVSAARHQGLL